MKKLTDNLRILVADDHCVVRNGIIKSISPYFPNTEFAEAENVADIMRLINQSAFDLVMLDISMPGRNGLEALRELKSGHPGIPVIVLSMYPEDQFAMRAIKDGASAYLTKDVSINILVEALGRILKGERFLTPSVIELITNQIQNHQDNLKSTHNHLSDREYQVFLLIASGKSVSVIARELSLSVKTISVYRSAILKKMDLRNNSEITHYAFKHNLVE